MVCGVPVLMPPIVGQSLRRAVVLISKLTVLLRHYGYLVLFIMMQLLIARRRRASYLATLFMKTRGQLRLRFL